jgi:tetratricopeptide (TPR) repeat protein
LRQPVERYLCFICLLVMPVLSVWAQPLSSAAGSVNAASRAYRYYKPSAPSYSTTDIIHARTALMQAVNHYHNRDYRSAERELDVYLKYFGGDDDALYMRGFCRYLNRNDRGALRDLKRSIAMNPMVNKDLYTLIGTIHSQHAQYHRAIRFLKKSLRYYPNEAETYNNLGKAYQQIGEHRLAYSCYNKAISLNPEQAIVYNNRGCVLNVRYEHIQQVHSSDINQALEDFDQALRMDSTLAVAHKNKSIAYYLLKQHERALEEINDAIRLDQTDYTAYYQRAKVHAALRNFNAASSDLLHCYTQDTLNRFAVTIEQGNLLMAQQIYDEAIAHFSSLLHRSKRSHRAYVHYKIAQCHSLNGDDALAVTYLKKAARHGYFSKSTNIRKFLTDDSFKHSDHEALKKFKHTKSKRFS